MPHLDLAIYAVHAAFWAAFGITRAIVRDRNVEPAPVVVDAKTAPWSRVVLGVHFVAFGVMYFGLGNAVVPARVPSWFYGQRVVGTLVMALGAYLMSWSLVYFRSWRFRAKLDAGHQLATGGPFALMRNPIYVGLDLLALGTAVWIPTPLVWAGFVLMLVGSDLRARTEEHLLEESFGDAYRAYRARTKRFIPGVY